MQKARMKLCFMLSIILSKLLILISSSTATKFEDAFFRKSIASGPEVCADCGCIRGKYESGRRKPYEAFYGIPYAEPPVGNLRLENPIPYHGWSGYWDASYPRNVCYQKNYFNRNGQPFIGSEDCLYLNVYRPSTWTADKKLPVLIYIHGGSYLVFSGNPDEFGPEYFMDNGETILVTMNYRLSIFGFLCSADGAVKGNFGLKDQRVALQWVATNIASFGGDASSITLSGQSAGAFSTNLHMMNPTSQALFHRVILMSGTALTPPLYPIDFGLQFRLVAQFAGIRDWETASTTKIGHELKKLDALALITIVDKLFSFVFIPTLPFRPCIEGDWEGAFMTEDPRIVWAEGRFAQKPILAGTTTDEGVIGARINYNSTVLDTFNQNIYELLPIQAEFNSRYVFDVLKFYFGDKEIIDETNIRQLYELYGDRYMRYPLITLVNQYLKYADVQANPIFLYEFGFESSQSVTKFVGTIEYLGVSHLDDMFYLFTMSKYFPIFEPDTPESIASDIYVRTMVNFVARGEVKVWRTFIPCTTLTSCPFCDRQIFRRYTDLNPNQVIVSVSNEVNLEMIKLWSQIDNGVKAINLPPCTGENCDC